MADHNKGGRPDDWFEDDNELRKFWEDTWTPLCRNLNQMLLDGVPLTSDWQRPESPNAEPWKGLRTRKNGKKDARYQHYSEYFQYWCIQNTLSKLGGNELDLSFLDSSVPAKTVLMSLGIDTRPLKGGPAKVNEAIRQLLRRNKDVLIRGQGLKILTDLIGSGHHIDGHLWNIYYGKKFNSNFPPRGESKPTGEQELENDINRTSETDKLAIVKQRLGQELFRKRLIAKWNGCSITGLKNEKLLRASHAKPWADCQTDEERLDAFNGFLLAPNFDTLFDQGLMTFENSGAAKFSSQLSPEDRSILGLNGIDALRTKLDYKHLPYIEWHRTHVFKP